ncbi:DNA mismatch repair protein MutS [Candidatus Falkowbacteria bacterium]|jgi:DNA mismatch repair protein MutS|nr:DNA mismatch repair protein MutS [Candidatus Falkowbacteria bacterium]MBT6573765.1 DNA mismatch repair protein MutS [Candidatus Falkowbacteria bacterium]MBT7349140.1 DNA mismatch repair protein MutS [Candidatus Falkowbacteria bacterium]MBT7500093.1 DNA mismatch repair protein MutS [Candidatus Falkowbacteria bacterium]
MAELTPMLRQYNEIKEKHPNELLFFRLGDFYELFGEDAKKASAILDIVLTARHKGSSNEMPMCGIPHHALENYLAKLLRAGQRVAICDQVGDASLPGIVKREVVQVVTPGTTLVNSTLNNKSNNFIAALTFQKNTWGLAIADLTTGEFRVAEVLDLSLLKNEIYRFDFSEIIINQELFNDTRYKEFISSLSNVNVFQLSVFQKAYALLIKQFKVKNLQSFGVEELPIGIEAAGLLLGYLKDTQKSDLSHITRIQRFSFQNYMVLDEATVRNLELFQTANTAGYEGSLLSVIDKTVTSMGGRRLRRWLILPLLDEDKINRRLQAVAEIKEQTTVIKSIQEKLKQIADLERLIGRLGCGRGSARDLVSLKKSLQIVPELKLLLQDKKAELLQKYHKNLDPLKEVVEFIDKIIIEEPPALITEGGMIKDGYSPDLDELRKISRGGKDWLLEFQAKQVERTKISSLKVKFNRVFGYYIEVSNSNLNQVPEDYTRKQTLVNAERFITPELKEYEEKILTAEDKIKTMELQIFQETVEKIIKYFSDVLGVASIIAKLDVLTGFALLANSNNYNQPEITSNGEINIKAGRHSVIEAIQTERYVPNDLQMDHKKNEFLLLTGPNMSGKSSYLRQSALICLLAQIGSFVPVDSAQLGIVDRIFTRVGASDNITQGVSTFMAEMQEAANILNNATKKSLIILDELGRGTSTYDGVSIAWAIIEHIHDKLGAKTIFATHYHELTDIIEKLERAENYCVAVSEEAGNVVFLHKIVKGATSESYGIEVAKLAGLPDEMISRATDILNGLEKKTEIKVSKKAEQSSLPLSISPQEEKVTKALDKIDVNKMTPLEALQKIAELKVKLDGSK